MASAQPAGEEKPSPANFADCCRLCNVNLRANGVGQLEGFQKIFDQPKPKKPGKKGEEPPTPKPPFHERLSAVGVVLVRREADGASERICKQCIRDLVKIENALPILTRFQKNDDRALVPTSTTTNASPTPTQLSAVPGSHAVLQTTPEADGIEKEMVPTATQTPTKLSTIAESRAAPLPKTPETSGIEKRLREPTPTKTPRAVKKLCSTASERELKKPPTRTSTTQVMVTYQSRLERPDIITCEDSLQGIVENLARGRLKTAARLMMTCDSLSEELKSQMLHIINRECKNLTAANSDSILYKSTPHHLQQFSLQSLHSDLQKLAPFALSVLDTITENSTHHSTASAAVALRGRNSKLSAFAYFINCVLQAGGAKTAVYRRLSKMGLTTTQSNARLKQEEIAKSCGEGLFALKKAIEDHHANKSKANRPLPMVMSCPITDEDIEDLEVGFLDISLDEAAPHPMDDEAAPHPMDDEAAPHPMDDGAAPHPMDDGAAPHPMDDEAAPHPMDDGAAPHPMDDGAAPHPMDDGATSDPQPLQAPSPPPPKFTLGFDNLDFNVQTHHQSQTKKNYQIHWTNHIAVQDRVSADHLPDDQPIKPLPLYDISDSLPTPDTWAALRGDFVVLGCQYLTRYVTAFRPFASVVINHIPHQYSDIMSQPSTEFPLGLLFKNETQSGDLVDILQHMQKEYVPRTPDGELLPIFVGGDRLSEGCSRNMQWSFGEGECREDRLGGLIFFFLDWHAIRNLHGIHQKVFLKEASSRDHGTFYANLNKIQNSNAKKGPHAACNAYKEAVHKDTAATFIAASLEHFGMDSPEDVPENLVPSHVREGTQEEKRRWLQDHVTQIVDKYVITTESGILRDLHDGVARESRPRPRERERHSCREPGCPKTFVYVKAWLKHERNVHGLDFGESSQQEESTAKPSPPARDHKKEHTEARLSFGLFLEDMQDAVREGDGERLMRLYKIALLYYYAYGHTQYAYSTLLLTVQLNALLTPEKAHRLTWNRFFNSKGGKGKNMPLDLHVEHDNNYIKSFLKGLGPNLTERSAARISKSLGCLKGMLHRTDEELGVACPSGYHHKGKFTQDIHSLVAVIREADLLTFTAGRSFNAFPAFDRNLFARIKYDKMWDWIKDRLKLWNQKY
ncbi:uncharacterized protein LOC144879904 [Branchiostoma floridae x Branchiostoma japonicum]